MKSTVLAAIISLGALFSAHLCQADVLISLQPSPKAMNGIEQNLLKGFAHLPPPRNQIPDWLRDFNFSVQPFHLSLGYIKNATWRKNGPSITQVIQKAVRAHGPIYFTFSKIEPLSQYVVIKPDQTTELALLALNKEIHDALIKAGYADGLSGSKGFGEPGTFLPHLSVAKTEDLEDHAKAKWTKRGISANFPKVLD
jgi:hypothetical protein